jgi:hypothetical protein
VITSYSRIELVPRKKRTLRDASSGTLGAGLPEARARPS